MKKVLIFFATALLAVSVSSCRKTCTCHHYNGSIVEFSQDDLEAYGRSCADMININHGLTYGLCERTF